MKSEDLTKALDDMHKAVVVRAANAGKRSIATHNRKTNVRPVNFAEGDFVLRGIYEREKGHKPSLRWKGPYRVVNCKSEFLFDIEDLITEKTMEFPRRRWRYMDEGSSSSETLTLKSQRRFATISHTRKMSYLSSSNFKIFVTAMASLNSRSSGKPFMKRKIHGSPTIFSEKMYPIYLRSTSATYPMMAHRVNAKLPSPYSNNVCLPFAHNTLNSMG